MYQINYKNGSSNAPVFISYNTDSDNSQNVGYKIVATGEDYSAESEADQLFTIVPSGNGYSLSAQGKYLKAPNLEKWEHLMFSDNKEEAGSYIFEEVENEIFRLRSTDEGINYINDYDKLVFGNDRSDKENLATFSITEITDYPFHMTDLGVAPLCLPFNVVMPAGMYAYDIPSTNIKEGDREEEYVCIAKVIAHPGQILRKGTPVIIKAMPGEYRLGITTSENGANDSFTNSILHGNYVMQNLNQSEEDMIFTFAHREDSIGFYRLPETGLAIASNSCWIECPTHSVQSDIQVLTLLFEEEGSAIEEIESTSSKHTIYNLSGQRINTPQKGINIIGNKKVIVK